MESTIRYVKLVLTVFICNLCFRPGIVTNFYCPPLENSFIKCRVPNSVPVVITVFCSLNLTNMLKVTIFLDNIKWRKIIFSNIYLNCKI